MLLTMEKYQLSQDFQEKQLQLLEKKYGGAKRAMEAALTIQRAFRRYSMAKKFADLTAQAKAEKRVSRRLDYPSSPSPAGPSSTSTDATDAAKFSRRSISRDRDGGLAANHHHYYHHHHHHHHHHANHRRHIYVSGRGSSPVQHHHQLRQSGVTTCPVVSEWRSQASTDQAVPPATANSQVHSVKASPAQSMDGGESSNSCPDIQSFPLDENSVYSHTPVSNAVTVRHVAERKAGSGSGHHRSDSNAKAEPLVTVQQTNGGHSHPHGHKRTVTRLGSVENGVASPAYGSKHHHGSSSKKVLLSQHQSSPQLLANSVRVANRPAEQNDVTMRLVRHSHLANAYRLGNGADPTGYTVNEVIRKRQYRTGLNIFNKKPEKGIAYLIRRGFLENSPQSVARFLITRKGLSKQMIGEYLGNINYQFNMATLNCFAMEMDFSSMQIDTALRKFQTYFRMPGEAQKIERIVEVFSARYCQCNPEVVAKFHTHETTFILAFAIILLNTDLHTPNLKPEKRMKLEDFVRNLRGIDNGHDVDYNMLSGIYERIRSQEFRPGSDHVTQVMKVQQTIVAKCPNLSVPHRRLVCYCRLYEVNDPYKKERPGVHQREVFLFNDILVITKIHSRKKNTVTYAFRQSYLLAGMTVATFETQFYPYGIKIAQKWDNKVVLMLNARNDHDRSKFVEDLKESVAEMDEMEALRLEGELEKQRMSVNDNRDSGINDTSNLQAEVDSPAKSAFNHAQDSSHGGHVNANGVVLRRSAINNSLLDLSEASAEKMTRRASIGSLDSGMSVSFQSNSVGSFYIGNNGAQAQSNQTRLLKEDCLNRNNDRSFRTGRK